MITLKQLRHAIALAKHGNFHRAANAEHLSQPALSRSITALEAELGVPLFDRHSSPVLPTTFGKTLLRRAQSVLDDTHEIQREIQLLQDLEVGSLIVAMGVYAAEMSAAKAMGKLIAKHPDIDCRLRLTSWADLLPLVESGDVDLAIGEISALENTARLTVTPVGEHELVFFCRAGHPLSGHRSVTEKDLANYPTAMVRIPPRGVGVFPGRTRQDPDSGALLPSIEVDDLASARSVIACSDAFGLATPLQIAPWLLGGAFHVLPFFRPWMKLNYGFIALSNRMMSPAASLYMRMVQDLEADVERENSEWMERVRG